MGATSDHDAVLMDGKVLAPDAPTSTDFWIFHFFEHFVYLLERLVLYRPSKLSQFWVVTRSLRNPVVGDGCYFILAGIGEVDAVLIVIRRSCPLRETRRLDGLPVPREVSVVLSCLADLLSNSEGIHRCRSQCLQLRWPSPEVVCQLHIAVDAAY